jgi:hypothetical protein
MNNLTTQRRAEESPVGLFRVPYNAPMAELKTKPTNASALAFIKTIPDEKKRADSLKLLRLFKDVTGEKPQMWGETGVGSPSQGRRRVGAEPGPRKIAAAINAWPRGIVGFGKYHYKSDRSSQEGDWPLTGFSPRKQSLTLYALTGIQEVDLRKLGKHKRSVSCLYINSLADVDLSVLKHIIKESYQTAKKRYKA